LEFYRLRARKAGEALAELGMRNPESENRNPQSEERDLRVARNVTELTRVSWRLVEQQSEQHTRGEPQQQRTEQHEQQHRFSLLCFARPLGSPTF